MDIYHSSSCAIKSFSTFDWRISREPPHVSVAGVKCSTFMLTHSLILFHHLFLCLPLLLFPLALPIMMFFSILSSLLYVCPRYLSWISLCIQYFSIVWVKNYTFSRKIIVTWGRYEPRGITRIKERKNLGKNFGSRIWHIPDVVRAPSRRKV